MHLSYAKTIIEELGKEKGEKLVLKAIKDYGMRIGSNVKKEVEKRGLDRENFWVLKHGETRIIKAEETINSEVQFSDHEP